MIEFLVCVVLAAFLWPAVIKWWRILDARQELDDLRPQRWEVVSAERELPEVRDGWKVQPRRIRRSF